MAQKSHFCIYTQKNQKRDLEEIVARPWSSSTIHNSRKKVEGVGGE